jgi:hypothetical protein
MKISFMKFRKNHVRHSNRSTIAWGFGLLLLIARIHGQSQLSLTYPFGVPVQQNSGMSFGMGGVANAIAGDYVAMSRNPANLGFIDKTIFSSLYTFGFTQLSESGNHSVFSNSAPIQVSVAFPMGKIGALGLSYDIRSEGLTKFQLPSQLTMLDTIAVTFQPGLVTSGQIATWQIGWGRELPKAYHLRVGATFERIYFSSTETILRTVSEMKQNVIRQTVSSRDSTNTVLAANGFRLGLLLPLNKFKFGLSGEYFFPGDLRRHNSVFSTSSDTVDNRGYLQPVPIDRKDEVLRVRMPPALIAGTSYTISPEWLAAADISTVLWTLYYSHNALPDARDGLALSVSGAVQYSPVIALLSPKYWETIRYAAGFRFTQLPAKESSEFALSLGTGLPIGRGRGEFNISAEAGRRTSGIYSGFAENFVHLAIGINGGRKWAKSSEGNY